MTGARRSGWRCRWSEFGGIACALLVGLLPLTDFWERVELRAQDMRFQWRGPRETQSRIVIAAVSEDTLQAWPEPTIFWGGHYGEVINHSLELGAAWIGLDAIQAVDADEEYAPQQRPTLRLAQALQKAGGHVMLSNLRSTTGLPVNPAPRLTTLAETADNIGFVDFPAQTDDIARASALFVRDREGILPGFIALLAARFRGIAPDDSRALGALAGVPVADKDAPTFWINYMGRPFPTVSADRLAAGRLNEAERQQLRGAIVLIGVTHRLSNDKHRIPGGAYVSGVEVQANALATLLDGEALRRGTRGQEALLTLALSLALFGLMMRLSFGRGLLLLGVTVAVWIAFAQYVFASAYWLLPVAGPILGWILPWLVFHSVRSLEEGFQRLEIEAEFGRSVSAEIRDYLLSDPARRQLGGDEREATILFMDIRGFTTYAQTRKPSDVVQELNALFREIVPAIDRHKGLLYKFTGDGLMAVFGVPLPLENNHAQAGVNAAREIAQAARRVNVERAARGLSPWKIGSGLHSGMVFYGNLGIAERSEFTVIGDTVNLAARLEGLNKELGSQIVISQATCDLLIDHSQVAALGEQAIRGRDPVQVYSVSVEGK